MITPIELQSKTFRGGFGYDKKDVDKFFQELLTGYETLYKEKMELSDKINTLNEGLNYYKTIEKTLQKALILAEQTAEETKEAARKQAKVIEAEARGNAQLIIADASNEYTRLKQQTIQLIRQYESYKTQFKHLAAAQCELLESDSFQIHIADLDMVSDNEIKSSVQKAAEQNIQNDQVSESSPENKTGSPDTLFTDSYKDKNMENLNEADEDFEFYNLSEEQE